MEAPDAASLNAGITVSLLSSEGVADRVNINF
jgi:hypothetical protein